MSQSSLSTQAKLLARYLREHQLADLSHTQALEALAHAHNVPFRAHKAQETQAQAQEPSSSLSERLKVADEIIELLYQTLGDWKRDSLVAYGLDSLYELAEAYPGKADLLSNARVAEIVEDVRERACRYQFIPTGYENALDLASQSAETLGLNATDEELARAAQELS